MKRAICFLIPVFFALLIFPTQAESKFPLESRGHLLFYVDAASFSGDEGFVYQEFYYEIMTNRLRYVPIPQSQGRSQAAVEAVCMISSAEGDTLEVDRVTIDLTADSLAETELSRYALQQSGFFLKPGSYRLTVVMSDLWSGDQGIVQDTFSVSDFPSELCLSDPEFALRILSSPEETGSIFWKNGKSVHPSASRRYSASRPELRVYFELYNCRADSLPLIIRYQVFENTDDTLQSGESIGKSIERRIDKPGTNCALTASIPVGDLPIGAYLLQITAEDRDARTERSARFFIVNPDAAWLIEDRDAQQRLLIKYLGDSFDLDRYDLLNPLGKVRFAAEFWRNRDPDPKTEENEYLMEIANRIRIVGERFHSGKKKGWETDAGRIFIKFGSPDEIKEVASSPESVSHEVWTYYENSRKFWFLTTSANIYRLIHSLNEPAETDYPDWKKMLRKFHQPEDQTGTLQRLSPNSEIEAQ